jgi:hypothetical protein
MNCGTNCAFVCFARVDFVAFGRTSIVKQIVFVSLACLALGACATPRQEVGTLGGVATGAVVGGPGGAVVGGVAGAAVTAPGAPLGGHHYRHRCHYYDRYGNRHYGWCH